MMRAESANEASDDELDAQICTKCFDRCRWVAKMTECIRDCRQYSC
jgi:hypothetical protein